MDKRARIEPLTSVERGRIDALLTDIGGPHVGWGAADVLGVLVAETQLEAQRLSDRRLLIATWVLALATVGLVAATIGLIVVTLGD